MSMDIGITKKDREKIAEGLPACSQTPTRCT